MRSDRDDLALIDKALKGTKRSVPPATRAARELESYGWRVWLKTMGPKTFTGDFAWFHAKFWDWLWPLLRAKQRGEKIGTFDAYLSYLLTLARGNAKSSNMEWAPIAAGALLGPFAALYTSSTEGLASEHLTAIQHRITTPQFEHYYPGVASAKVGKYGSRAGWNKNVLKTESGLTVYAVGLNQDVRGLKDLDLRVGMEVFDDFDSRDDSPDVIKKKEGQIGGTILPMGTSETINIMGQNLIHENSVANRILLRHSDLLNHRKESGVIPAFENVEIEQQGDRHVIVSGTPNWAYFDMQAAQKFLDDSGPLHWQAEYQHNFTLQRQGLVLSNYDDDVHVITQSEFESVFGSRTPPDQWNKYIGHDWAKTKTEFHANVVDLLAISDQNTKLPGRAFLFDTLTFEPNTEPDDVALAILNTICPKAPVPSGSWDQLVEDTLRRANLEQYLSNATALIEARHALLAKVIPPYVQTALRSKNYRALRMSHEALGPRQVYEMFGLHFEPINPGKQGGVELINSQMQVDMAKPHPFRPGQMGDTRFFIVVRDNERDKIKALKPEKIHGQQLARYQFSKWRWLAPKLTESGIEERGPEKRLDDVGQALCMIYFDNLPRARELNYSEKIQAALPEEYTWERMVEDSPYEHGLTANQELAYAFQVSQAKKAIGATGIRKFTSEYRG